MTGGLTGERGGGRMERSEFVVGGAVVAAGTGGGAGTIDAGGGDGAGASKTGGIVATTGGVGSLVIAAGVGAIRWSLACSGFCHIL
jgi:hypothetical protein